MDIPSAAAESEIPGQPVGPRIHGMSPERAQLIPGIEHLFSVRTASQPPEILDEPYLAGEIVARFPLELSDSEVWDLARAAGADRVVRKSPLGLFLVQGPANEVSTERMLRLLWESELAFELSPNYTGQDGGVQFVPNDTHHVSGAQWYLESPSDIDLDMEAAWEISRGSTSVVVAVMDTGILTSHPEFAGRLWVNPGEIAGNGIDDDGNEYVDDIHGWDSTSPSGGDANIEDDDIDDLGPVGHGHGTYVSSLLLANSDNAHQIAGFDHFAKLLTVRSFNSFGPPNVVEVVAGLDYLVINSALYDVLNMSWYHGTFNAYKIRLNMLQTAGALMITGSGNNSSSGGADNGYPSAHPGAISVAATDANDAHAPFSNTGSSVQFSAPGVDIYTASYPKPGEPHSDPFDANSYHQEDGTSFSTPMVAATAMLSLAIRPAMTHLEFITALRSTSVDLGSPGWDQEFGWGRINTNSALEYLRDLLFLDGFESGNTNQWSSAAP